MVALNVNLSQTEASIGGSGAAKPAGWYTGIITETTQKNTDQGKGRNAYLEAKISYQDGTSALHRFNLFNDKPDAVEIAHKELAAFCDAMGIPRNISDSQQLHNTPFEHFLDVQDYTLDNGKSGSSNRVVALRTREGKVMGNPVASERKKPEDKPQGHAPGPGGFAPPANGAAPPPGQPWGAQQAQAPQPQQPAPQPQPQAQQPAPQGGFPAPQPQPAPQGGFPAPGQQAPQGGFPAPQPQPQGGFPTPQAPQGGFPAPGQAPQQGFGGAPGGFPTPQGGPWGGPQQ